MRFYDVFCAVPLSSTMWSAVRVLLEKTASVDFLLPNAFGLPSFQWRSVPLRNAPRCTQSTCNHMGFEPNVAVVHGVGVSCVDVRRCDMCRNLLLLSCLQ